ncbi:hypothetical protein T4A_13982 [Trichinella pseudospiralis]|uniref:Uncharacterized protein n=1 Tax=Trichinella pseudospiralis TaxID=6337 RepID=A0A0V1DMR3_TRIPS|nr:hypothetical protein T4A_13982 [Trichinella pseudospiralis]
MATQLSGIHKLNAEEHQRAYAVPEQNNGHTLD